LQVKLQIKVDGDFGRGTEKAVKEFQHRNGLTLDGIVGKDTRQKLGL
jgi:peptidoglycan hydrolase-like protein with peptidoglycan-binding domain